MVKPFPYFLLIALWAAKLTKLLKASSIYFLLLTLGNEAEIWTFWSIVSLLEFEAWLDMPKTEDNCPSRFIVFIPTDWEIWRKIPIPFKKFSVSFLFNTISFSCKTAKRPLLLFQFPVYPPVS